jgi:hypothetical protein
MPCFLIKLGAKLHELWNCIYNLNPSLKDGTRDLVERYDRLTGLACHTDLLNTIPIVKIKQWAL